MKLEPEPVRGFRDLFGEDAELLSLVMKKAEKLAERWSFERSFLPTVERFELFAMKSGVEIERTMYVFLDKAGRKVSLRPEATASAVRAYLRLLRGRPKPLKIFTIVNVFRYDEPQYARYREFYQADFEVFGASDPFEDAELVTMLHEYYEELDLPHVIVIGSVRALRSVLEEEGVVGKEQDLVLHYVDKGLVDKALEVVASKARNPERAGEVIAKLAQWEGGEEVIEDGKRLMKEMGYSYSFEDVEEVLAYLPEDVKAVLKVKLGFARGLAYYTGLIYEVKVPGFPVSVAGGGRYDTLTEVYGWERVPATGFAIGLDRTALALKERGRAYKESPLVIVLPIAPEARKEALAVQRELASLDVRSLLLTEKKSVKKAFSYASESGARVAVVLGRKEVEKGFVSVKNLVTGEQRECRREELLDCVANALKRPLEE
ncbi:MAG: histidine--tRNA ligase [Crenarchaeota archaeon]|nr:histidine--tRNA ligase [Thermoproteota archaeon]